MALAGRKRNYQGDYNDLKPSCVLHLRELPSHTLEIDLLEVFARFGHVKYVSMIPDSHQALLEYYSISSAIEVVQKYRDSGITLNNGSLIKVNFSTSTSISLRSVDDVDKAESPILGFTVYRATYPITTELIHKIVSQFGKPLKILIIRKKNIVAFVEFATIHEAKQVKMRLNGADVYSGCCSLKVDFAPNRPLRISHNDMQQWDSQLETMDPIRTVLRNAGEAGGLNNPELNIYVMRLMETLKQSGANIGPTNSRMMPEFLNSGPQGTSFAASSGSLTTNTFSCGMMGGASSVVMIYGLAMDVMNCDRVFNLVCLYGNVVHIKFLHSKEGACMVQMGDDLFAQNLILNLSNTQLFGKRLMLQTSKQSVLQPVSNPYTLPDGSPSYKEYSISPLNRFLTPEKASRNRICRPIATVHFWNCPPTLNEENIRDLFNDHFVRKPDRVFLFPANGKSNSGLVEWNNVEDATNALAVINHKIVRTDNSDNHFGNSSSGWNLKLSYSLNSIKSRSGGMV